VKVNRFAERLARAYHRLMMKNQPINFLSSINDYRDCLVCLPANMEFILEAASKLPHIAEIFPNRMINVLLTSNIDVRSHDYIKRFTIIKPYSNDINVFYLPKRSFIDRVTAQGISVCIDLDFKPNFFNSSVCIMTKAPVRIGFAKGLGLPYYNLEIDVDNDKTPVKESYEQFIKVLYNFRSEGERIAPIET
jgi:hypothetical protein